MMDQKKQVPQDTIEHLQKDLYSREFTSDVSARSAFSKEATQTPHEWHHADPTADLLKESQPRPVAGSLFKKIFVISALFFLISAGVAVYIFYGGFDIISQNKVDMVFTGPVTIPAGNPLDIDIDVKNQNSTPLTDAQLYIDYPDGTKETIDLTQDLLHEKDTLGDIPARSDVHKTISAVLYGKQDEEKEIDVTLEYGVKSSNALYRKQKSYKVAISSTPLTINIDHPTEVAAGQDLPFTISVASNSTVPLTNLVVTADYPFGFAFTSSDASTTSTDSGVWSIPVLKPGETKTISFHGILQGQENDEKIFRFNIGLASTVNQKMIATDFLSSSDSVIVRRPPLAASITLNGVATPSIVVGPSNVVQGQISLTNNMAVQVIDTEASLVFSGDSIDPASPSADQGLYRLPTRTITWDKTTAPALAALDPGGQVTLSFTVASLPQGLLQGIKNGKINISLKTTSVALGVNQTILASDSRTIQIQPSVTFTPQLVYSAGPFKNTGPVPPQSDATTTYTIHWSLTGSSDEIDNAKVVGTLPSYVKWLNVISPATENVTWDPEQHLITWSVGTIPAGQLGQIAREVYVQVALNPSYNQIQSSPDIIRAMSFTAQDAYTGKTLSTPGSTLTTNLSGDPKYPKGGGLIIK